MKKLFTLIALIVLTTINAQAPQGFNYQATVRNAAGDLIINQNVTFKFNIMLNTSTSLPVFSETHYVPTDDLGQVNLTVGEGTATTGTFGDINWGNGSYYLGIELSTGANFVAMGTTQLLSVPYALYANSAGNSPSQGKPSIYLTGDITNAEAAARIASQLGPVTENIYIQNTTQLTTVDLSAMEYAADIRIEDNNVLTSINLSGLKECYGNLRIYSNPLLTTVSFSALTNSRSIEIYLNPLLTTVSFPAFTNSRNIGLGGNALSIATINALLNKMLSVLPSTGKYIDLSGQTPLAPPSGQGIIDKQTLIDAGNSVYTDEFTVPILITIVASAITVSTANCGGNITNTGAGFITSKGMVWSTSNNPTIENNMGMTSEGTGIGSFTSAINQLTSGTLYYVRAYATNSYGTAYGQEEVFTTLAQVPSLTTIAASEITSTTASSGGTITNDGGDYIIDKGIVWSTSNNPTIENNMGMTSEGTGIGSFTSTINQLTPGTHYYVRAYATNTIGTAYGIVDTFTTPLIVTIGTQVWSNTNLNVETYSDGTPIPQVTDQTAWANLTTGAWCYYNNDLTNGAIYGKLYNWYAVAGIHDTDPSTPNKLLAPQGWHVPSDVEWTTLTNSLGGLLVSGGKMKEIGITHWMSPNTNATNTSGFSGRPGSYRTNGGVFSGIGYLGYWWSSSVAFDSMVWERGLNVGNEETDRSAVFKTYGLSVRCVRD